MIISYEPLLLVERWSFMQKAGQPFSRLSLDAENSIESYPVSVNNPI